MNEIASRYATALFSLKKEKNQLIDSQLEVKEIIKVLKENPDFLVLLDSSYKEIKEKEQIVDQVFKSVDEDIRSLIKIVCRNHRSMYLTEIFVEFNSLVNEYRGVIEGLVYSAIPLNEKEIDRINQKISEVENRTTELKNIIDPSLIGGVKVVINDHIYDGSLKHQIENMKITLLK